VLPKPLLEGALYAFDSVIEGNAVEVHVSRLRQKLGARLIETCCGPGQCRHDRRTGQALVAALPSDLQRVLVIGGWLATIALSALVLDHEMKEMFDQELETLVETTVLSLDMAQGPLRAQHRRGRPRWRKGTVRHPARGDGRTGPLAGDGQHDAPGWRILRHSTKGAVIEAAHATAWRREKMLEAASAFLALPPMPMPMRCRSCCAACWKAPPATAPARCG
jgi:hypothetical protein